MFYLPTLEYHHVSEQELRDLNDVFARLIFN